MGEDGLVEWWEDGGLGWGVSDFIGSEVGSLGDCVFCSSVFEGEVGLACSFGSAGVSLLEPQPILGTQTQLEAQRGLTKPKDETSMI